MNKYILILIYILSAFCLIGNEVKNSNSPELLKRNVLILPFLNQNKIEKYDYLSDTLMDVLKADIMNTNQFNLSNPVELDKKIGEFHITEKNILKPSKAVEIAVKLESDVVVTGKYIVVEEKIMILVQAVDVLTGEIAAALDASGATGINLLNLIDKIAQDITAKMVEKLPKVDRTYFKDMTKIFEKKEREKRFNDFKSNLTLMNKTGFGLCIAGTAFFITGLPIFIYDLAGYSGVLRNYKNAYAETNKGFDQYLNSYYTFVGLFFAGLIVSSVGLVAAVVSIPLIIIKNKNKQAISVNFEFNYFSKVFISLKI